MYIFIYIVLVIYFEDQKCSRVLLQGGGNKAGMWCNNGDRKMFELEKGEGRGLKNGNFESEVPHSINGWWQRRRRRKGGQQIMILWGKQNCSRIQLLAQNIFLTTRWNGVGWAEWGWGVGVEWVGGGEGTAHMQKNKETCGVCYWRQRGWGKVREESEHGNMTSLPPTVSNRHKQLEEITAKSPVQWKITSLHTYMYVYGKQLVTLQKNKAETKVKS